MNMQLEFVRLNQNAVLPARATEQSAGLDLFACIETKVAVLPGKTVAVGTGLSVALPLGTAGLIYARSGLATRHGIVPSNAVGVIDSDYRGEIIVSLRNFSQLPYVIAPGERIAQLVVTPVLLCQPIEVAQLAPTERGAGGFGSTGKL